MMLLMPCYYQSKLWKIGMNNRLESASPSIFNIGTGVATTIKESLQTDD